MCDPWMTCYLDEAMTLGFDRSARGPDGGKRKHLQLYDKVSRVKTVTPSYAESKRKLRSFLSELEKKLETINTIYMSQTRRRPRKILAY